MPRRRRRRRRAGTGAPLIRRRRRLLPLRSSAIRRGVVRRHRPRRWALELRQAPLQVLHLVELAARLEARWVGAPSVLVEEGEVAGACCDVGRV